MAILQSQFTRRAGFAVSTLALVGLAACSGSGTSPKPVTQANTAANVLQLAVGTANIYGTVGTNIVATYRQPSGLSATLVNSPMLTGPFKLAGPAGNAGAVAPGDALSTVVGTYADSSASPPTVALAGGPASGEIAGDAITSTAQSGSTVTSFGTSGGVFGLGIEPFNYNNQNGVPFTVVPYQVPLYDSLGPADPNSFTPWGGPPAFDPNKDGQGVRDGNVYPTGTLGISEGLDVFEGVAPSTAGPYTLSAPSAGTSAGTIAPAPATFTLKSTAVLPAAVAPTATIDGGGGASFVFALPAGVTGAYVQVADVGPTLAASGTLSCNAYPLYYTFYAAASGTVTLGDAAGNGGAPSICTSAQNTAANTVANGGTGATLDGDSFSVQLVGFDYPAYAASYPNSSGNSTPTLVGAAGQADITISPSAVYTQLNGVLALSPSAKLRFKAMQIRALQTKAMRKLH